MCKSIKYLVVKLYMKRLSARSGKIGHIILARSATSRVFIQSVRAQDSLQLALSWFSYTKIYNFNYKKIN